MRLRARTRISAVAAFVVGAAATLAAVPEARAEDARTAAAEALFREGRRLIEARDYEHACPKLAKSYDLDPATGALLALAVCQEGAGRLASAWATYALVAARSKAEGRLDREQAALAKVAALEPGLPMLTISVAAAAEIADLHVRRDDQDVARAVWGVAVPADAGDHVVVATATGRRPWRITIALSPRERKSVEIPPLEIDAPAPAPPASVAPSARRHRSVAELEAPRERAEVRSAPAPTLVDAPESGAPRRRFNGAQVAGLTLGAAGLVALGGAGAFSLRALSKQHEADQQPGGCPLDCPQLRDANSAANVATVFAIAGGVLAAAGVTTYLLGRSGAGGGGDGNKAAMQVVPVLATGEWQLGVAGRF